MGSETRIEWADHTFNAWRGCSKVAGHPACDHCYAEAMSKRNPATLGTWGDAGRRVVAAESYWQLPFRWNRQATAAGRRATVFALSLGDVFEDWRGVMHDTKGNEIRTASRRPVTMGEVRGRLLAVIDETPALIWLLLTKRPERIRDCLGSQPRANVMFGTSASDQATLVEYGRRLLDAVPRWRAFLSLEPLVGPVDLVDAFEDGPLPAWIIAGGESGPHARPCNPDWVHQLRQQCALFDVPFFFKQWGEWSPLASAQGETSRAIAMERIGKKLAGRTLGGKTYSERPAWFDAPIDTAREGCI